MDKNITRIIPFINIFIPKKVLAWPGCCDGSPLSSTCAPHYPQCNGSATVEHVQPTITIPTKVSVTRIPTRIPANKPSPTLNPTFTPANTPILTHTPTIEMTLTPSIETTMTPTPTAMALRTTSSKTQNSFFTRPFSWIFRKQSK